MVHARKSKIHQYFRMYLGSFCCWILLPAFFFTLTLRYLAVFLSPFLSSDITGILQPLEHAVFQWNPWIFSVLGLLSLFPPFLSGRKGKIVSIILRIVIVVGVCFMVRINGIPLLILIQSIRFVL